MINDAFIFVSGESGYRQLYHSGAMNISGSGISFGYFVAMNGMSAMTGQIGGVSFFADSTTFSTLVNFASDVIVNGGLQIWGGTTINADVSIEGVTNLNGALVCNDISYIKKGISTSARKIFQPDYLKIYGDDSNQIDTLVLNGLSGSGYWSATYSPSVYYDVGDGLLSNLVINTNDWSQLTWVLSGSGAGFHLSVYSSDTLVMQANNNTSNASVSLIPVGGSLLDGSIDVAYTGDGAGGFVNYFAFAIFSDVDKSNLISSGQSLEPEEGMDLTAQNDSAINGVIVLVDKTPDTDISNQIVAVAKLNPNDRNILVGASSEIVLLLPSVSLSNQEINIKRIISSGSGASPVGIIPFDLSTMIDYDHSYLLTGLGDRVRLITDSQNWYVM